MDDVFVDVVFATGDEALDTFDVPAAIGLLDGLRAACADVRSGIGLGEDHRGSPGALEHDLGPVLLLIRTEVVKDRGESGACQRHVDGWVGAEEHFRHRPVEAGGRA